MGIVYRHIVYCHVFIIYRIVTLLSSVITSLMLRGYCLSSHRYRLSSHGYCRMTSSHGTTFRATVGFTCLHDRAGIFASLKHVISAKRIFGQLPFTEYYITKITTIHLSSKITVPLFILLRGQGILDQYLILHQTHFPDYYFELA